MKMSTKRNRTERYREAFPKLHDDHVGLKVWINEVIANAQGYVGGKSARKV